jgi:hypothetical protein
LAPISTPEQARGRYRLTSARSPIYLNRGVTQPSAARLTVRLVVEATRVNGISLDSGFLGRMDAPVRIMKARNRNQMMRQPEGSEFRPQQP